uniref:Major sperm protein n=1 Tax=Panagrellus redivivus TaxID=6233 RepID=A0A7E4W654_PANRE
MPRRSMKNGIPQHVRRKTDPSIYPSDVSRVPVRMAAADVSDAVSDVSEDLSQYEADEVTHQTHHTVQERPPIIVRVAKSLSTHEWLLLIGAAVSMYLVNGTYAGAVCSLCTNLPAVVHSYRVITDEKMPLVAYQSVLCYWILLGSLTVFDHTLANTFCYFFAKFLLLSAVYAHVVSKSRKSSAPSGSIMAQSAFSRPPLASRQISKNPASLSQPSVQSAAPLTAKDSSFANYLEWMKRKTGDMASAFQGKQSILVQEVERIATGSDVAIETEKREPAVHQHRGDGPETFSDTFSPGISDFGEVGPADSNFTMTMHNENVLRQRNNTAVPSVVRRQVSAQTTAASTDWSRTFTAMTEQKCSFNGYTQPSVTAIKPPVKNHYSVESVSCFENDIASVPMHTIMFRSPFNDHVTVTLTNITTSRIMWALKTNAIDKIIATPTCGFMPSGSTVHLKLALREGASTSVTDSAHDRLAIDYVFVESNCVLFDPARITSKTVALRRKAFEINYSD